MKLQEYLDKIVAFLKAKIDEGFDGYVLGISGGIDSALVAALAKKAVGDKLFCLVLPCESNPADEDDARLLAEALNLNYQVVDLTNTYQTLMREIEPKALRSDYPLDKLAHMNAKVRLRMVTLYAFSQARHALVLGTDNWDESYTGYFTKYGDGGVDLLPIVHLTKGEVMEAARLLGIPEKIISRKPSAGLFEGQTDEGEMGVTYAELDRYLLGGEVSDKIKARIEHLHKVSAHKREPLPTPEAYIRD